MSRQRTQIVSFDEPRIQISAKLLPVAVALMNRECAKSGISQGKYLEQLIFDVATSPDALQLINEHAAKSAEHRAVARAAIALEQHPALYRSDGHVRK